MMKIALPYIQGDDDHYKKYVTALENSGMESVLLHSADDIPLLDGLLLPGGADVDPAR